MPEQEKSEIVEITIRVINKHIYYKTRQDAESTRQKGDRLYYDPVKGWYIHHPRRKNPWEI